MYFDRPSSRRLRSSSWGPISGLGGVVICQTILGGQQVLHVCLSLSIIKYERFTCLFFIKTIAVPKVTVFSPHTAFQENLKNIVTKTVSLDTKWYKQKNNHGIMNYIINPLYNFSKLTVHNITMWLNYHMFVGERVVTAGLKNTTQERMSKSPTGRHHKVQKGPAERESEDIRRVIAN